MINLAFYFEHWGQGRIYHVLASVFTGTVPSTAKRHAMLKIKRGLEIHLGNTLEGLWSTDMYRKSQRERKHASWPRTHVTAEQFFLEKEATGRDALTKMHPRKQYAKPTVLKFLVPCPLCTPKMY